MSGKSTQVLVVHYDHDLDPLDPQNQEAAKVLGWTYDPDYHAYRDEHNFVMFNGDSPQNNNVDCWR